MRVKVVSMSVALLSLAACVTSPTGRRQLHLVSLEQAAQAGDQ